MIVTRLLVSAAIAMSLAACAEGGEPGRVSSSVGTSQGIYANPTETPARYRLPQTNLVSSGIPGESGLSSTSSALSGGDSGVGGASGSGHGGR